LEAYLREVTALQGDDEIDILAEQVNADAIQLSEIQGALHEHVQRLFDIEGSLALLCQNKYHQEQEEKLKE